MSRGPGQRPTLIQVAEATGYSPSTVSRALREDVRVTPETRDRIQAIASSLGFIRNTSASSLRSGGSSSLVGLLIPDVQDSFFAAVAAGVQAEATNHHLEVLIGCHNNSTEDQARLIKQMASHRVQAIVIAPAPGPPPAQLITEIKFGITVVSVDRPSPELGCDVVTTDNADGSRQLVAGILQRGHRHFALVGLGLDVWTQRVRFEAVTEALAEAGITVDPDAMVFADKHGLVARKSMEKVLSRPEVTAVIGMSALVTVQALEVALRLGLHREWASFDGHPLFDLVDARMLCVEQNASEVGRSAIGRLIERRIHGALEPRHVLVPLAGPVERGQRWKR